MVHVGSVGGAPSAMMIASDWPGTYQVSRQLDLSQMHVHRLIREGRLRAAKTMLGYLIDPESAVAYERERAARMRVRGQRDGAA